MYFSTNAPFRVVETDFLAGTNHVLYIFQILMPIKAFFPIYRKRTFERILHSGSLERIFLECKPSTLFGTLFLIPETVTDMIEKQFLKTKLILASGN